RATVPLAGAHSSLALNPAVIVGCGWRAINDFASGLEAARSRTMFTAIATLDLDHVIAGIAESCAGWTAATMGELAQAFQRPGHQGTEAEQAAATLNPAIGERLFQACQQLKGAGVPPRQVPSSKR